MLVRLGGPGSVVCKQRREDGDREEDEELTHRRISPV
jgi:hypothetical protein